MVFYRAFAKKVMNVDGYDKKAGLVKWITGNMTNLLLASVLLIGIVMIANGIAKKLFGGE